MATQMQIRGGTTAENLLFTGAQREVTYDTEKNTLIGHDGVTPGGFPMATEQALADGTIYYNDDIPGGSVANAYLLVPKPNTNAPNAYLDGVEFGFVTSQPNTGPATANFQGLGVKNIKYPGGVDPAPGDVLGRVDLVFDLANDWLELQRKPLGPPPQIRSLSASSTGNALSITLQPCTIDFRSSIPTSGAVVSRTVSTSISITVPAGATLGTVSGVQSKIVLLAIDNGGTVELAVVNLAGATPINEMGLINTAILNAASTSATTIYSQAARSNVAYRVMGYVQSTQAAAGTWSSSPSQVQGQGGQAIIEQKSQKELPTAWVNFNGAGTVSIRDSFNISSITDLGVGSFRLNFSSSMSNTNYATVVTHSNWTGATTTQKTEIGGTGSGVTISGVQVDTLQNGTRYDPEYAAAVILGGK